MSLNKTPSSDRLHIAIFGKRNVGKSTLINVLTNQDIALVSNHPGTTTDPVKKAIEILPIGPCLIIDTAGLDDVGELGEMRIKKSLEVMNKTDIALIVVENDFSDFEKDVIASLSKKNIPFIFVINKIDTFEDHDEIEKKVTLYDASIPVVKVSAKLKKGINELKGAIIKYSPKDFSDARLLGDLISPGDFVILVCPIDTSAPKGRLILPQVQAIRDVLDSDCVSVVTKEHELRWAIDNVKIKPKLVVTDSQVFSKVSADTPNDIKLTSFSILMARLKGDIEEMIRGVAAVSKLKTKDKVLISEACTHHRQSDDIGTVKIPRWLQNRVGGGLEFEFTSGSKYPDNLSDYNLVVHCGGCMINRKEMLYRIFLAKENKVPIVNYGVLIAYLHGIMPRAIEIFPYLHDLYNELIN